LRANYQLIVLHMQVLKLDAELTDEVQNRLILGLELIQLWLRHGVLLTDDVLLRLNEQELPLLSSLALSSSAIVTPCRP
jgi:hypothetical protein